MARGRTLDQQREIVAAEAGGLFDVLNEIIDSRMMPVFDCDDMKKVLGILTARAGHSDLLGLVDQPLRHILKRMREEERFSRDIRQAEDADILKEPIKELEQAVVDFRRSKK